MTVAILITNRTSVLPVTLINVIIINYTEIPAKMKISRPQIIVIGCYRTLQVNFSRKHCKSPLYMTTNKTEREGYVLTYLFNRCYKFERNYWISIQEEREGRYCVLSIPLRHTGLILILVSSALNERDTSYVANLLLHLWIAKAVVFL